MRQMRNVTISVLALALLPTRLARAQACHVAAANDEPELGFRLSARSETAGFRTTRYEGHYQGLFAGALVGNQTVSGEASLPYYRILRNGLRSNGPGDLGLAARARFVELDGKRAAGGLFLSLTVPTGDPERDLGMGHVMLMPGVWGHARFDRLSLSAELAYGSAIGAQGGEHHAHHADGESPIVNPMGRSELEPLLAGSLELIAAFSLHGGAFGGFPLDAGEGTSRAVAFLGVEAARGAFGARLQGQMPFVGDPFTSKLALELSVRF